MNYLLYNTGSCCGVYTRNDECIYEMNLSVNEMDELVSKFEKEKGRAARSEGFSDFLTKENIEFKRRYAKTTCEKSSGSYINHYYVIDKREKEYAF